MHSPQKFPEFKAIFLGNTACGKTSILMRYQHDYFPEGINSTVAGAFVTSNIETPEGQAVLNIWDTAGQEKYRSFVPMYVRGASVALIVFDVTDRQSFNSIDSWISEVDRESDDRCTIYIVGNKADLPMEVEEDEIYQKANLIGAKVAIVSAKTGEGILHLFQNVIGSLSVTNNPSQEELSYQEKSIGSKSCCG